MSRNPRFVRAVCLAATVAAAGCAGDDHGRGSDAGARVGESPAASEAIETTAATAATGPWTDAFAYCSAVGTVDAPDQRFVGPDPPPEVVEALRRAVGLPPEVSEVSLAAGSAWRCMDGQVVGCFVGANLPCWERAETSREPSESSRAFCAEHPGAEAIPAVVTGRATIFAWRCRDGQPEIAQQVGQADPRGFLESIWQPLAAPSAP